MSVGFITDSVDNKKQADEVERMFSYYFYVDANEIDKDDPEIMFEPRFSEVKDKMNELLKFVGDDLSNFYTRGVYDNSSSTVGFAAYLGDNDNLCDLCKEVEESTEPIAVAATGDLAGENTASVKTGDTVNIFGRDFKVIGTETSLAADYVIPYRYIPDDAIVDVFQIFLTDVPTQKRVTEISDKMQELFKKPEYLGTPEIKDLVEEQTSNMYIFVSIIVMIIVMLDISLFYKYIFDLRLNEYSIFKVCGASNSNILAMTVIEMLAEYILSFAVASLLFRAVFDKLKTNYPGFSVYETNGIYPLIAVAFFAVSVIIAICIAMPYSKKSPTDTLRYSEV
jgi:ABC-type antimicrobial peptide transport system permease subunit